MLNLNVAFIWHLWNGILTRIHEINVEKLYWITDNFVLLLMQEKLSFIIWGP